MRRRRRKVADAEASDDDPWAVRMVFRLAAIFCISVIGVPVGLPMIIMLGLTEGRNVVIRVLASLAAGAAVITLVVLMLTTEGSGGGYDDICWDSPGGAYRC